MLGLELSHLLEFSVLFFCLRQGKRCIAFEDEIVVIILSWSSHEGLCRDLDVNAFTWIYSYHFVLQFDFLILFLSRDNIICEFLAFIILVSVCLNHGAIFRCVSRQGYIVFLQESPKLLVLQLLSFTSIRESFVLFHWLFKTVFQ